MFFQPPEEQSESTRKSQNNPRRRRKKKNLNKNKRKESFKKKQSKFAITMSSWADNFITAATWQMKHQIAYWKSKARALEYENRILHEIIRTNTTSTTTLSDPGPVESSVNSDSDIEEEYEEGEDDNFEVSEEFIQFLKTNAKYKEDARRERERLQVQDEIKETMLITPPESRENSAEKLRELYGKDWEKISALEISMQCDFIEKVDKCKPMYWPNIPFNFNFC